MRHGEARLGGVYGKFLHRPTHTSLLSPAGHQPGSQTPPRSAGGQGWPVCMLKASPTLLAPQLPPGMLRGGWAADKGHCSPLGQAGVVGSWGRMATICLCTELPLCISTGQGTWTETGSQPPPHWDGQALQDAEDSFTYWGWRRGYTCLRADKKGLSEAWCQPEQGWPGPASTVGIRKSEARWEAGSAGHSLQQRSHPQGD